MKNSVRYSARLIGVGLGARQLGQIKRTMRNASLCAHLLPRIGMGGRKPAVPERENPSLPLFVMLALPAVVFSVNCSVPELVFMILALPARLEPKKTSRQLFVM